MHSPDVYWVIGDSTNCGKTTIACATARVLNASGRSAIAFKPILGTRFKETYELLLNYNPESEYGLCGDESINLFLSSDLSDWKLLDVVNPFWMLFRESIKEPMLVRCGSKSLNTLSYHKSSLFDEFAAQKDLKNFLGYSPLSTLDMTALPVPSEYLPKIEAAYSHLEGLKPEAIVIESAGPFLPVWREEQAVTHIIFISAGSVYLFPEINLKKRFDTSRVLHVKNIQTELNAAGDSARSLKMKQVERSRVASFSDKLMAQLLHL